MVFHWRLQYPQKDTFKVSHLCYAATPYTQYQAIVKLLGSFRLTTGRRHLHRHCIFTEQALETVPQSLRHSCTSELRVSRACTLYVQNSHSIVSNGTDYIFICDCINARISSSAYLLLPLPFILNAIGKILRKPFGDVCPFFFIMRQTLFKATISFCFAENRG